MDPHSLQNLTRRIKTFSLLKRDEQCMNLMLTQIRWLISSYPEIVQERVDSVLFTAAEALTLKTHPHWFWESSEAAAHPRMLQSQPGCSLQATDSPS